jgi:hypothetical protein
MHLTMKPSGDLPSRWNMKNRENEKDGNKIMRPEIFITFLLVLLPSTALAHGEEIVLFWGVEAIVISAMVLVFIFRKGKTKYILLTGLSLGWMIGWFVTWDMKYYANTTKILKAHLLFPLLGLVISLIISRLYPKSKSSSNQVARPDR